MGTISFTVHKDSDPSAGIVEGVMLSDADIDRVAAAAAASYFPNGVPVTPATNPPSVRAPTSAEIVQAMVTGVVNGWVANVLSYERGVAAANASAGIQTIQTTPI